MQEVSTEVRCYEEIQRGIWKEITYSQVPTQGSEFLMFLLNYPVLCTETFQTMPLSFPSALGTAVTVSTPLCVEISLREKHIMVIA